jgi:ADP-heptose:LPS heptosyltransferase
MDIEIKRRIDRTVGKFICRILSLFPARKSFYTMDFKPRKILVILLSEMGSLVLAHPMFDLLKKRYPDSTIYALCFTQNREILEIIDVIPKENILSVDGNSFMGLLKDSIKFILKVRKINIDTVIDCELFSRISSIFSFFTRANIHVGFHAHTQEGLYRGGYINHPVLYNPYIHISEQFINLVEAIQSYSIPRVKRNISKRPLKIPPMNVTSNEINKMKDRFEKDFPQARGKKIVLLHPGGGLLPVRAWPLENFKRLADGLVKMGYVVGIVGMERDKELARAIIDHCKSSICIDLTGYTKTVRDLMLIFHFASLLITNDGGPGHFASMTPIHAIILYGPETPILYGSISERALNIHIPVSCSPCLSAYNHRNSPCDGNNICLKLIRPEDILEKAFRIIENGHFY